MPRARIPNLVPVTASSPSFVLPLQQALSFSPERPGSMSFELRGDAVLFRRWPSRAMMLSAFRPPALPYSPSALRTAFLAHRRATSLTRKEYFRLHAELGGRSPDIIESDPSDRDLRVGVSQARKIAPGQFVYVFTAPDVLDRAGVVTRVEGEETCLAERRITLRYVEWPNLVDETITTFGRNEIPLTFPRPKAADALRQLAAHETPSLLLPATGRWLARERQSARGPTHEREIQGPRSARGPRNLARLLARL